LALLTTTLQRRAQMRKIVRFQITTLWLADG
jgi:hypothetical protein